MGDRTAKGGGAYSMGAAAAWVACSCCCICSRKGKGELTPAAAAAISWLSIAAELEGSSSCNAHYLGNYLANCKFFFYWEWVLNSIDVE